MSDPKVFKLSGVTMAYTPDLEPAQSFADYAAPITLTVRPSGTDLTPEDAYRIGMELLRLAKRAGYDAERAWTLNAVRCLEGL